MRALGGVALILGMLTLGSVQSAVQDQAMRLYDEARSLVEQAETVQSPLAALSMLDRARANLDAIVERHSATQTASPDYASRLAGVA